MGKISDNSGYIHLVVVLILAVFSDLLLHTEWYIETEHQVGQDHHMV